MRTSPSKTLKKGTTREAFAGQKKDGNFRMNRGQLGRHCESKKRSKKSKDKGDENDGTPRKLARATKSILTNQHTDNNTLFVNSLLYANVSHMEFVIG